MSQWKKIFSHYGVFGTPSSFWKETFEIFQLTVPTSLTDSLLPLPGPGGRSVSPSDGCSRPWAQRWRPGCFSRWFTSKEAHNPEGHAAALTSPVRTAEERQPHLGQPPPGERNAVMQILLQDSNLMPFYIRCILYSRTGLKPHFCVICIFIDVRLERETLQEASLMEYRPPLQPLPYHLVMRSSQVNILYITVCAKIHTHTHTLFPTACASPDLQAVVESN